ncbi:TetR family transcriptional regulator [Sphingomonas sp. CFBP 13728]|uniref:TetR/AcrR family transcriptional regulator n=1 Tax=Sphingomonas sp. CFBP 13728 TaxID=2775294 RepID=UPI001781C9F0|nr:TetR/AcrR family transcriptional regulator [Sphingomonas sp. CFBP 13728]MBD8620167.1 TetR family transcriptional regulator [Sphingomonas sp. CFBP 13728]
MPGQPAFRTPSPSPFQSLAAREALRLEKRDALLRAAVMMFNERGFHATSLDDVAASLGVTKPVIYHHLGNKDQVLFACVRIGLEQLRLAAEQSQRIEGDGLERLKAFLRRYAEVTMDDFGRCVIRTPDEVLSPDARKEFRALKAEIDATMRAMIEAAVADRSATVLDVRLTAFTLAGALNWPARWFRADGPMSAQEVARDIVEMLCAGLRPAR